MGKRRWGTVSGGNDAAHFEPNVIKVKLASVLQGNNFNVQASTEMEM